MTQLCDSLDQLHNLSLPVCLTIFVGCDGLFRVMAVGLMKFLSGTCIFMLVIRSPAAKVCSSLELGKGPADVTGRSVKKMGQQNSHY